MATFKLVELVEQFFDQTAYKAEVYVYNITSSDRSVIVYGYDKYNGYINFYDRLENLLRREFQQDCEDIEPFVITKDQYDNDEEFQMLLMDYFFN